MVFEHVIDTFLVVVRSLPGFGECFRFHNVKLKTHDNEECSPKLCKVLVDEFKCICARRSRCWWFVRWLTGIASLAADVHREGELLNWLLCLSGCGL